MYLKAYTNYLPMVQVMAIISLLCNSFSQLIRLKVCSMTGRACMEVVLIQEETSKLFNKQVSDQKVS